MERLFIDLFRIQVAMLEGWLSVMSHMCQGWQHAGKSGIELIHHPDIHRWHNVGIINAPDWADHYGKRAHDVDVEHLR